jgi:hypothetical protein
MWSLLILSLLTWSSPQVRCGLHITVGRLFQHSLIESLRLFGGGYSLMRCSLRADVGLVFQGGRDADGNLLDDIYSLDPATGVWTILYRRQE